MVVVVCQLHKDGEQSRFHSVSCAGLATDELRVSPRNSTCRLLQYPMHPVNHSVDRKRATWGKGKCVKAVLPFWVF
jgi:hypothetical protein